MFLNTLHDNRNKELATDASAVIAMTEEEKRRLQELLSDVDTFEETVDEVRYWIVYQSEPAMGKSCQMQD